MDYSEKKGLFYLPIFKDNFIQDNLNTIKNLFSKKYKNIAYFTPIGGFLNQCFTQEEFEDFIINNNEKFIRKSIIKKYEELLEKNDFVIVIGVGLECADKFSFYTLVAKDLNIALLVDYYDEKIAKFHNIMCKKYNVENFGYIKNNIITFNDNNSISLDELHINALLDNFEKCKDEIITPIKFEYNLFKKAATNLKTIVLPEGNDERILKAADILVKSKSVNLVILGKELDIKNKAEELRLDLFGVKIIDIENSEYLEKFANSFYELRKNKGISLQKAKEIVKDRNYFATMMVYSGLADGVVSGADGTTADTIRPALQIIKTKEGISSVSGIFFMCLDTKVHLFVDCAIVPNPTPKELANFAISSINTAKSFKMTPKVAMLSYSTADSGFGKSIDEVKEATNLAKSMAPNELIDGPIQFDAAVDKKVGLKKMPNSKVAGDANVFIFPDLNCGNITYKAVQRTAGAVAVGPILQGLKKPINDLSRGCNVEDIVNTVLMSAIQAGE